MEVELSRGVTKYVMTAQVVPAGARRPRKKDLFG